MLPCVPSMNIVCMKIKQEWLTLAWRVSVDFSVIFHIYPTKPCQARIQQGHAPMKGGLLANIGIIN